MKVSPSWRDSYNNLGVVRVVEPAGVRDNALGSPRCFDVVGTRAVFAIPKCRSKTTLIRRITMMNRYSITIALAAVLVSAVSTVRALPLDVNGASFHAVVGS